MIEYCEQAPFKVGDIVEDSANETSGEILHIEKSDKWDSGEPMYGYTMRMISSPEPELIGQELFFDVDDLIDYDFIKVG
jgi:hypothetical protein